MLSRDLGERLGVIINAVGRKAEDNVFDLRMSIEQWQQSPECVTHIRTRPILLLSEVELESIEQHPEKGVLCGEKLGDDHNVALSDERCALFAWLVKKAARRSTDPGIRHSVDVAVQKVVHESGRETGGY